MELKQQILDRIGDGPAAQVWTPVDFLDLGSRDAVDSVEYTGDLREEAAKPPAAVSAEQVTTILQELESIGFFGIEDSAFEWCFDTPRIAVLVSIDGVTHHVSSDAWCAGAALGTQARFVQVANEIDRIIGPKIAQGLYPGGWTRAR